MKKSADGKSKASSEAIDRKSAEAVAETIGTSRAKVEKARAILDYAPEEVKAQVLDGTKSINIGAVLRHGAFSFDLRGREKARQAVSSTKR